jgi:2,4-dienoyl-CoA reductase-like NADH-dependent reductase (Old Yellow Enzyme family)
MSERRPKVPDDKQVLKRDPNPHLFRPLALRSVTAKNRIMLSPMCQYSAEGGVANLWHVQHLCARAAGGAGIVFTEVVHVEERGRITPGCLGLWNDAQRDALAPVAAFIAAQRAVPAIQIGHAGRKAAVSRPWEGNKPLASGAWPTIGPSPIAHAPGYAPPKEMGAGDIATVLGAFNSAVRRARAAGFKLIEIHAAHGYLLHSFLSPVSNARRDAYGGTLANRARLLMDTIDAVRAEWPAELPLAVRLSCVDWVPDGLRIEDAVEVARLLKARGDVDFIDCSSGGIDNLRQRIPTHPGYQVGFAERIRREAGIATAAVGLIHSPDMAEEILANGRADLIVLGRTLLGDPFWPMRAAKALRAEGVRWPVQYERANIF